MTSARLESLGRRIELVATDPDAVRAPWSRLVRPILSRLGWQPKVRVEAARAMLTTIRAHAAKERGAPDIGIVSAAVTRALDELEQNLVAVERACVVNRRAPVAHAAWLRRLYEVVGRVERAIETRTVEDARVAAAADNTLVLPPLSVRVVERVADRDEHEAQAPTSPSAVRVLELQLAAIDHLIDAARAEPEILARRRRLLEAARQVLLETSAAIPLERDGAEARRAYIASEIARIDRLEAAGLSPDVGVLHQARGALARGERQKLHAALVALDGAALGRGDGATASRTGEAIRKLWRGADPYATSAVADSIARSGVETFGATVVDHVATAYRDGRKALPAMATLTNQQDREFYSLAHEYLAPGNERATLSAALAVDGCFEVGGVMSPVRVTEYDVRARAVRYPTQDMVLMPAQGIDEVPDAVIEDPRTIVLSLAAGRLLARRFVLEEHVPRSRAVMSGEVRVYVLDGSGSMLGPRARMRDSILLAELSTLMRRLSELRRSVRVSLYYRYFSDTVGPTTRVDSEMTALAAMTDVLKNVRGGGTDIEAALVASFVQVREARASDPDLARAQIVLITDGEAVIREDVVNAARESVGDLPVGVSVIALGVENPALRGLVARQRARGERAFYHFVEDAALAAASDGRIDDGPALHLPELPSDLKKTAREQADELDAAVGALLDDLGALGQARDLEALESLDAEARARAESGLAETEAHPGEGERARVEALRRDRRALERRYGRWFPPAAPRAHSAGGSNVAPEEGTMERDDLDAVLVALGTVAEVVGVVGGSDLARRADAVDVLERLLPDARLSPARYEAVLQTYPAQLDAVLTAVHRAVTRPG